MADLRIQFDIRLSKTTFLFFLTALFLSISAANVGSESVTLNTYYPAPSGVYQYMVTTNNSYLARDAGDVGIGTTSPASFLDVRTPGANLSTATAYPAGALTGIDVANSNGAYVLASDGTRETFMGSDNTGYGMVGTLSNHDFVIRSFNTERVRVSAAGNVGIGNNNPGNKLAVNGLGGGNVDLAVTGRIMTGDGGSSGGIWTNSTSTEFMGDDGGDIGWWTSPYGWSLMQANNGKVGIGETAPVSSLDVGGPDSVLTVRQTGCSESSYTNASISTCPGGYYATLTSGVMVQYTALAGFNGFDDATGAQISIFNGSMLCCLTPSGGMPAGW